MNAASVIGRLLPPFFADRYISHRVPVPVGCYMLTCVIRQDGKPSHTNPMHLLLGNYNPRLDPGQLTGGIDRHIGHVRLHQWQHTSSGACNSGLSLSGPIQVWDQARDDTCDRGWHRPFDWSSNRRGNPRQPVFSRPPRILGSSCVLRDAGFSRRSAPVDRKDSQGRMEPGESIISQPGAEAGLISSISSS